VFSVPTATFINHTFTQVIENDDDVYQIICVTGYSYSVCKVTSGAGLQELRIRMALGRAVRRIGSFAATEDQARGYSAGVAR
jgi:hypothetical protein